MQLLGVNVQACWTRSGAGTMQHETGIPKL